MYNNIVYSIKLQYINQLPYMYKDDIILYLYSSFINIVRVHSKIIIFFYLLPIQYQFLTIDSCYDYHNVNACIHIDLHV